MRLKDNRQEKIQLVKTCLEWILTKLSAKNIEKFYGISRFTFYRKKKEFFKILPEITSTGELYDCVLVDGTHIKKVAFLIAKTPDLVISSVWSAGETGEVRTNIFYCNPYSSFEKGAIEKNHEYIRYVLPKKTSFEFLTQDKVDKMMSHINSTKRPSTKNASLYRLACLMYGEALINSLGIIEIPSVKVNLTPKLIK